MSAPPAAPTTSREGLASLALGLLCVSTAGPFLVQAHANAAVAVALRMLLAAPLLLVWARGLGTLGHARPHLSALAQGAALLTVHFLLWVKAFDLTSYASNLVLLVAQPAVAALVAVRRGERSVRATLGPVALALAGLVLVAGGDVALGPRALLGDLCCVLAGAAITAFYERTRVVRVALSLPAFLGLTFGMGGLFALPVALAAGAGAWRLGAPSWGWLAGLVLVTTIGGHGLMNRAARTLPLFAVNMVIVLEPVLSLLLGRVLFGATLTGGARWGGPLLLAAALWGLWPVKPAAPAR